jgi:tetratricopeptide (TPR) repeat protein
VSVLAFHDSHAGLHVAAIALLVVGLAAGCRTSATNAQDSSRTPATSAAVNATAATTTDPEARLAELRKATRAHPADASAWRELGDACHAQDRIDEAEAAWERSLALDPAQAEVHWALGTIYTSRNQDDRARKAYERALELDPDHHGALFNLGNLALTEGRLDEAEALLRRAAPRGGYASLGRVYAAKKRWQEAAAAFEQGLKEPGDRGLLSTASDYADLGEAWLMLGRDADATRALTTSREAYRALEQRNRGLERGLGRAAYLLARLSARSGARERAQSYLQEAFQRDPTLREVARAEHDLEQIREAP